jgi:hypothetical protein
MKIAKLTRRGEPIYINSERVRAFHADSGGGTRIVYGEDDFIDVDESVLAVKNEFYLAEV